MCLSSAVSHAARRSSFAVTLVESACVCEELCCFSLQSRQTTSRGSPQRCSLAKVFVSSSVKAATCSGPRGMRTRTCRARTAATGRAHLPVRPRTSLCVLAAIHTRPTRTAARRRVRSTHFILTVPVWLALQALQQRLVRRQCSSFAAHVGGGELRVQGSSSTSTLSGSTIAPHPSQARPSL